MLSFLRNLKISQKLGLIVLLMGGAITVVVYLYVAEKNLAISSTRKKIAGIEYLAPLKEIFRDMAVHRGSANAFLNGNQSFRERLQQSETAIDKNFKLLEAKDAAYGADFKSTEQLGDIKQKWEALRNSYLQMQSPESFDRHTKLIAETMGFMRDLANNTTLVLDPQLDTYYMVSASIISLPRTIEDLGQTRGRGAGLAAKKLAAANDKIQMSALVSRVQSNLDELDSGLQVSFKTNPELQAKLGQLLSDADAQTNSFLNLVKEQIILPDNLTLDSQSYFEAGTRTIEQHLKLNDSLSLALNDALRQRESLLVRDRSIALGALIVGIGFALALAIFITLAITKQIGSISKLFSNIGMGDFGARAEVYGEDELGNMSFALNAMLDNTLTLIQSREERDQLQDSIQKLLEEIAGVAEGDLTKEAEVTAEATGAIADSFNFMIAELRKVISNVHETTLQVSAAASEIQTTTEHLARESESQTSQILDTTSAVDEMAASIHQVSENSVLSATVAEQAKANARQGTEAVQKTISGMNGIRQQVQETAKRIKRLGESSQEIGEIVQLIGDIADRTSILALNASIQSAMAGEAGRGFGVVAAEVERLADRSAEATKRIATLIKSIQSEMTEAVSAMEATTREVVSGSELASDAGKALSEIDTVSNRMAELIQSISMAAKQQARGSESVAKSMGEISQITQQTAAGTKQAAVSIHNLAELADNLRSSVSAFRLPANGHSKSF